MENFSSEKPNDNEKIENDVESAANFEGNESLILIERLKHPVIFEQIVEVHYHQDVESYNHYHNENWQPYLPEGWTGEEENKLLKGEKSGEVISVDDLNTVLKYLVVPDKEKLIKDLEDGIKRIEKSTDINFVNKIPNADSISVTWEVPWTQKRPTVKMMSITEAHEKGHHIRNYYSSTEDLRKGFDISEVDFSDRIYRVLQRIRDNPDEGWEDEHREISKEEIKQGFLYDYLFRGDEISERMSQLKNYFGFHGDEKFTKEHLHYAKEYYIKDTESDNGMTEFFEAITEDTEDKFIELINSYGI